MERIKWLNDFNYTVMASILLAAYPNDCSSLLHILEDNGLFPDQDEAPSDVD